MIQWTAGRHALTPRARHRRIWLYLLLAAGAFVSLGLLGCGSGAQQPRAQYAEHASSGPTAPAAMHDAWQGPLPASSGAMPTSNAEMQPGAIAAPPKGRSDVTRLQRESWASGKKEKTALREPSGDETSREDPTVTDAGTTGPMLIYKANLQIAAFEIEKTLDEIEKKARELGGYLVTRTDQRVLTVRVPARHFNAALRDVQALGDVLRRNVQVDDVTDEYFDIEVRLKNALAMRDRLEQLLAKAKNVSESLVVEQELSRVAGDIERLRGRLRLMGELAAYSTITVQVTQVAPRRTDTVSGFQLPFPWLNELGLRDLMRIQ